MTRAKKPTMKAVTYTEYGPPEVLRLQEVPKPTPLANEILIKVMATEATKSDCELRSFKFPVKWFWLPLRIALGVRRPKRQILGAYFAGTVEAVGAEVSAFNEGDEVFGSTQTRFGAYGEYICLPESYTIVKKPENMSFVQAAAVPLGGLNALHFMNRANIQPGEKVLINGAGGSIGTFGLQIAKSKGAEVTTVDSATKETMLRANGADHFVDYQKQTIGQLDQTFDVVLDMVAQSSYSAVVKALRPNGRYLMANPRLKDMLRAVWTSAFSDKKVIFAFAGEKPEELQQLKTMIEAGSIYAVVDQVFPFAEAATAHHRVEAEQRLGIVVLSDSPSE